VDLFGGAGDDTFSFASTAQNLDGIKSLVSVDGGGGKNVVNVFDNKTTTSQYYRVLRDQFTRTPIVSGQPAASPTQTIDYKYTGAFNAHFGSGYQLVDIASTMSGTTTTLYGGTGETQFMVAN